MVEQKNLRDKKILMIHFRVGKTDGVSLQFNYWQEILNDLGAEVALLSGPVNEEADYIIPELEQQLNPQVFKLDENAFGGIKDFQSKQEFNQKVKQLQNKLYQQFLKELKEFQPDRLLVSNIFSVGEHLPAAGALAKAVKKLKIPTVAVHHDFYWESPRCCRIPSTKLVKEQIEKYFPPQNKYFTHCTINSIAQQELKKRKGIEANLLYDTHDFKQPAWEIDDFNQDLFKGFDYHPNDIIVLQATRIVRRKNIELAIDLVAQMDQEQHLKKLTESKLYNNQDFDPKKNKIVLVLAGYAEKRDQDYKQRLLDYAKQKGITLWDIGHKITGCRCHHPEKKYSLWDVYPYADMITYPSCEEGFGNQFLEAIFAKKPVATFQYPVFELDIKPKGFEFIDLGNKTELNSKTNLIEIPDQTLKAAAEKSIEILTNKEKYNRIIDKNYQLGKKNFSYDNAQQVLSQLLTKEV
jgi:glycosyltransferase involved in cell wall biosynthesis